jgi:hypothetical protein
MIRGYCCQFNAIVAAIKNLFYFFQKTGQLNADYHEDLLAMLEVIKEYGGAGSMTHLPNMLKRELETNGTDLSKTISEYLKDGKKTICKKFLAALMLSRANRAKHNDLKEA